MGKAITPRRNEIDPGSPEPLARAAHEELTIEDWQRLVDANAEKDADVQRTIQILMLNCASGRTYFDYVTRYRPELREEEHLDFFELITMYEAIELLNRLLAEPRCGTDPDYFLWKDVWDKPDVDPSYEYEDLVFVAHAMENQASVEAERTRVRVVREAVERELRGEEYIRRKNALTRKRQ